MAKTKYFNLDRDNLLGGNNSSDFIVPSQRAVKRYVDENSNKFLRYKGTTTTIISDYSTENPIVINGQSVTVVNGDCVIYSKKEFVWTDGAWHEFGDIKNYVGGVDIDIVEGTPLHNLPAPYIELAYVQNSSNTSVNTTIRPNVDDVEIDLRYLCNTVGSNYIFQSRQTTGSSIFGISGSSSGGTILLGWNGSSVTSDVRRTIGHTYTIQGRFVGGSMTLVVLDETAGNSHTATGTYTFATPPTPFYLFGNAAGNYIDVGHYVYYACIKVNGVAVMEYIPCMNNGDAGFYDTVSETFIVATNGTLLGGPEASEQSTINFTNETGYVTTDRYHTSGSWSGLTYTATPQGGAGALSFTVPTGTSGTTVALGNHTHSEYASSTHIHGNINNGGALTDTAAAASGNDYVVIRDASDSKIQTSTIKGVDVADAVSKKHSHSNITLSTTSQTYDGTHTIVLPSSDPYSSPRTPASHSHGNINNDGELTDTVAAPVNGDYIVLRDGADDKIKGSNISFDGSTTNQVLSKKGTWVTLPSVPTFSSLTLSTTAQAYDGTHTLALPSSDPYSTPRTPSSHTHGNIQNNGTLQTNDITIANGDKLVVTDGSDSNKIARTSVEFDGSTTTKYLSQAGTWVSVPTDNYHTPADGATAGVKIGDGVGGVGDLYVPYGTTTNAGALMLGTTSTTAATGDHTHSQYSTTDKHIDVVSDTSNKQYIIGTTTTPSSTASNVTGTSDTSIRINDVGGSGLSTSLKYKFLVDSQRSMISGIGIDTTTNLGSSDTGSNMNMWFRTRGSNPLIGFRASGSTTLWYFQATSTALYLGPTSTSALWMQAGGNAGMPNGFYVGASNSTNTAVRLTYDSTNAGRIRLFNGNASTSANNVDIKGIDGSATFAGSVSVGNLTDNGLTASQWVKTDANKKLVSADLPTASTSGAGIVQLGSGSTDAATGDHAHGNIGNGGTLTDTAVAASGNDYVVIRDASDNKIQTSTIKGVDVADAISKAHTHSDVTLNLATPQTYDGTHTIALPATDPYTSARTPTSHTHGNIQNDGTLSAGSAPANGDTIVVRDSNNSKVKSTNVSFDGSTTNKYLSPKGTWENVPSVPTFSSLTLSGTAQAYDGTHTLKVQDGTTSQKGIVQLGTTAGTAAEGNHTHPEYAGAMVFRGTKQTNDSTTPMPVYTSIKVGDTWKIIKDGNYTFLRVKTSATTTEDALVGDTIVCTDATNGYWSRIPSGDEPSGTVTSITAGGGLTGGTITTSGTIAHADIETTAAVGTSALKKITTDGIGHIVTTANVGSSDITSALGYTPYNSTNPNGYTSNTGTVTSITAGSGLTGGTISTSGTIAHDTIIDSAVSSVSLVKIKTDSLGHISATSSVGSSDITTALGYTPYNSTNPNGYTSNTGTVTSVRVQATSPVQSSTSTASSTTLDTTISLANAYGDTKNPYGNKNANVVLAGPSSGSAAAPTFRSLVAADIPDLSGTYKTIQTAKSDPTASTTTSTTFIDTITQDTNGVITATKKTLPSYSPSTHTHGNITNGGAITSDVTIATGDKLVITDNSDSNKVARASISFDTGSSAASLYLSKNGTWTSPIGGAVKYSDVLMPTNPFGGKQLYINSIDNAFHAADKKSWVKVTTHERVVNGVTYPYIDETKTMQDADYFVDSPIVSTLPAANLFDGNYENGCICPPGRYMKVHIQFSPFTDSWTPATGSAWSGYPYGTYYLSYYHTSTPSQLSQCRVYNKFQSHGIGWHLYTASVFTGSLANNYIEQITDSVDYTRTCVEFIIYGKETTGNAQLTDIDYRLLRPNLSANGSTVTKYGDQSLYYNFSWYKHNDDAQNTKTVEINAATGKITSTSIETSSALTAVAIANGDSLIIADSSNGSKMTPTTITFDGSTATKYLSQKGTWENAPTDTNYYHSSGSWSNLTYTATNNGGTSCPTLSLTIPTGTSGTTVALGNHSHGNISNTGTLTDTVGAPANGDYIVIRGASGDAIKSSNISFDASTTNQVLSKKGTWVSLPTDTNYYHSTGTWNGLTYTASNNGGTSCPALSLTIPTGTSATTVALGNHTHSNYASSTHTHSISVGSGTANYTPAGSITNGTISVSGGTTASNLLTKSSTFTVTPTSATTTKLSASMASNVVTSATKTNVHAASSQPSTTLSTAASGDVTVATGGTEGTAASSTHTHSVPASTSTAVSAYTSNTPTYKKATTTTQTAGTAASWATEQTLVSGTTDDYCLSFVFTANTPSSVATTVATGAFESGTSSNGVLGSISFGTTDCAAKGHTHTANSSSSTPQTVITAVPTTCLVASTTTPTITLSKPSGTTASGDIEVIGSSSSGTVSITLSTGTAGSVDIPTNAISGVSVAPASNTTTESAIKTIGTFSQGTSTFSGTGVELVTSTPE